MKINPRIERCEHPSSCPGMHFHSLFLIYKIVWWELLTLQILVNKCKHFSSTTSMESEYYFDECAIYNFLLNAHVNRSSLRFHWHWEYIDIITKVDHEDAINRLTLNQNFHLFSSRVFYSFSFSPPESLLLIRFHLLSPEPITVKLLSRLICFITTHNRPTSKFLHARIISVLFLTLGSGLGVQNCALSPGTSPSALHVHLIKIYKQNRLRLLSCIVNISVYIIQ